MEPPVEWDPRKAHSNLKKHGVAFTEALTAMEDEMAITIEDEHADERRFITLGLSESGRLVVVVYTYRGESVRIISARKATATEKTAYEE